MADDHVKTPLEELIGRELGVLPESQLRGLVRELRVRRVPSPETVKQRRTARPVEEKTAADIIEVVMKKTGLPREVVMAALAAGAKP